VHASAFGGSHFCVGVSPCARSEARLLINGNSQVSPKMSFPNEVCLRPVGGQLAFNECNQNEVSLYGSNQIRFGTSPRHSTRSTLAQAPTCPAAVCASRIGTRLVLWRSPRKPPDSFQHTWLCPSTASRRPEERHKPVGLTTGAPHTRRTKRPKASFPRDGAPFDRSGSVSPLEPTKCKKTSKKSSQTPSHYELRDLVSLMWLWERHTSWT